MGHSMFFMEKKGVYELIILVVIISVTSSIVTAQNTSTDQLINNFKEKYGSNWLFEWNNVTDTPHAIYGSIYNFGSGDILDKEKADQIAYSFLIDNKNLFRISEENIKLSGVDEGNNEWYVTYMQYYGGVLVYGSKIGVTLSKKGELISSGSDTYSNINVNIEPKLSQDETIQIAQKSFNYNNFEVKNSSLSVYLDDSGKYHLIWIISLFSAKPLAGKEFFVDANNGEILLQHETIISASTLPNPPITKGNTTSPLLLIIAILIGAVFLLILITLIIKNKKVRK